MKVEIVKAALFTPIDYDWALQQYVWGLPVLVEDEPGCGKTSRIRQLAAEWRLPWKWLSPGAHGEGQFGVIPQPVNGRLTYPRPDWTDAFVEGGRGLILVDEITSADRGLQPPMLGLVSERTIGNFKFPPGVRILGACNPVALAANGDDLAPPLANRFGWQAWGVPTVDEHRAFIMGAFSRQQPEQRDPVAEELRVVEAWPEAWAWAAAMESGFLQAQPHLKNQCPKDATNQGRAWPSDRTWYYATLALASSRVHGLSDEQAEEFCAGFIGAKTHGLWAAFMADAKMPNLPRLLDGEEEWEPELHRLDRAAAVLAGCTATLVGDADKKRQHRRAQHAWKHVFHPVARVTADLVVPTSQALIKASLHAFKEAIPVLALTHPVTSVLSSER